MWNNDKCAIRWSERFFQRVSTHGISAFFTIGIDEHTSHTFFFVISHRHLLLICSYFALLFLKHVLCRAMNGRSCAVFAFSIFSLLVAVLLLLLLTFASFRVSFVQCFPQYSFFSVDIIQYTLMYSLSLKLFANFMLQMNLKWDPLKSPCQMRKRRLKKHQRNIHIVWERTLFINVLLCECK